MFAFFLTKIAFFNFFGHLLYFQPQDSENLIKGLIIGYCIVSNDNGEVFNDLTPRFNTTNSFQLFNITNFIDFLEKKLASFLKFFVIL